MTKTTSSITGNPRSRNKVAATSILIGVLYSALILLTKYLFGSSAALIIGLGLAATAVVLMDKLDKLSSRSHHVILYPIPGEWYSAAAVGILVVYSADVMFTPWHPLFKELVSPRGGGGFVPGWIFLGLLINVGFFLTGLVIGSLIPDRAAFASSIGVLVYFTLKIPTIFSPSHSWVATVIPDITAVELKLGALLALLFRIGLTLYGARVGTRRWTNVQTSR